MNRIRPLLGGGLVCLVLAAAIQAPTAQTAAPALRPAVPRVEEDVEPQIARHLAQPRKEVMSGLESGLRVPGHAKTALCSKAFKEPWGALADLEAHGLGLAAAASAGDIGLVLERMAAAIGRPAGADKAPALPDSADADGLVAHITAVFDAAAALRAQAGERLSDEHRKFLCDWSANVLRNYGPQLPLNDRSRPILQNDRAFVMLAHERLDWSAMTGAARILLGLAGAEFRDRARAVGVAARPAAARPRGVTGPLLAAASTPYGWILIGGKGRNTYDLAEPVACIVDIGGDDEYRGTFAASTDAEHPLGVVIDLAGHDRYAPKALGLATGRFGIGLLADLAGNDTYLFEEATGGVGLAGIGLLLDVAGNDTYTGSKFTQGVALGGIGLLVDLAGDDKHTAFGYSLGLGGAAGVGAVIDVAGNDDYQCGEKYPSGYNALEKPPPEPGNPRFQWTAFGMGMGLGRRIVESREARDHAFALAGGIGMILDVAGDDRYRSSNFSQGCGYYFGAGLKLDLQGKDSHGAARYGHASGAHFGLGLFVDYAGVDEYGSTGPTYNGGCAWDHSVFLCLDAGTEGDTYVLDRSAGLGRADIGSWGVFADLGGPDRYVLKQRPGRASQKGVAVFYDRAGEDTYEFAGAAAAKAPRNGELEAAEDGGMFWDRQ
ncbi:MAG: hypothetical protein JXQ29_11795 [Planctomycetes bacterium]|nr:hypothetical protein [Planctomycetota bacterium]